MNETVTRLIQVAAKRFGVDGSDLRPEHDIFEKLGIDSFQAVELMSEVEMDFDVEIPDYEVQGVNTLGGLAELIEARR